MTLGWGHGKVIQYISPGLSFFHPKYLKFSANGFDVRGNSHFGSSSGNELKTLSHPGPRWLNDITEKKEITKADRFKGFLKQLIILLHRKLILRFVATATLIFDLLSDSIQKCYFISRGNAHGDTNTPAPGLSTISLSIGWPTGLTHCDWADTRWPLFSRRYLQMDFLGWNYMNCD